MAASKALDRYTGGKYQGLQAKSKIFSNFFNTTALKIVFLLAQYMHHISCTK